MKKYNLFIKGFSFYIIMQCLLYFIGKFFQSEPHIIGDIIDNRIPFLSFFVIFYCLWFVYLLLIPLKLYQKKDKKINTLFWSLIISIVICNIFFMIYPSTITRATIIGDNIFDKLVKLIYFFDNPPLNCLPSMHCLFALFFIYSTFNNQNFKKLEQYIFLITNILIILSTMFIKQHVLYDFLLALIISIPIWLISSKIKTNYLNLFKKR